MGMENAKNLLELKELAEFDTVPVTVRPVLQEIEELAHQYIPRTADVVVWAMDRIQWGVWDGQGFQWCGEVPDAAGWQEIRWFNREEELRLQWTGDALAGRYIRDREGTGGKVVDSFSRLWGKKASDQQGMLPGFVRLQDVSRKLQMEIPFHGDIAGIDWYGLTTRNYIGSDEETGLSGYIDDRFVAIESAQGV